MLHGLKHRLFKLAPDTGAGGGVEVTSDTNGESGQDEQAASQQQVDLVDTEAIKSQAISELLGQLGVASVEDAQANLASWNEYQEGQKTELQKIQDNLTVANNSLAERDTTIASLQAQLAAAQLGVPAENTSDVITLAKSLVNEKTDINTAISTVLEKYPHFKGGGDNVVDKPNFVTQTQSQTETAEDAFAKALGLK
ncbi:hypothetical protein [Streptococcus suis]|uniref:hypothetical protein n=1 Tax=Streptococcus suis TaxID=1307 RepID=UPI000CF5F18D|nr:hypothetical protein [Streptococcus suis]HEM4424783.1 hypothetical protein [Streptococcus suis]HEM5271839.1 hypothetical protein [Streptococcus suis]HEM5981019.1 hypothetical protein [Streptococcus suis]HEM6241176.1 hypothetical protein [Streptococcus suis]HEM6295118.1 hypothetical protein [Streptococcus suis]